MSMTGEIRSLFLDKEKNQVLFPTTKVRAISDDNGVGLDAILDSVNENIKKAAPHNLLDNSDFTNPVNQRGQTSYSGAGIYAIDRWKIGNTANVGICTLSDVGIILSAETDSNDFEQRLENYGRMKGNKYTIAYKDSNGVVYCLPFTMGGCNGETIGNIIFYSVDGRHILFRIPVGLSVTIVWAALYEGEYTAETLPEYHPKGYGAELAECQRYYYRFDNNNDPCWLIAVDTSFAVGAINYPVRMRVNPTITNLRCLNLSSQEITITSLIGTSRGASYANGTFTTGAGYRVLFEASADL